MRACYLLQMVRESSSMNTKKVIWACIVRQHIITEGRIRYTTDIGNTESVELPDDVEVETKVFTIIGS